jgi:hypothetical protein
MPHLGHGELVKIFIAGHFSEAKPTRLAPNLSDHQARSGEPCGWKVNMDWVAGTRTRPAEEKEESETLTQPQLDEESKQRLRDWFEKAQFIVDSSKPMLTKEQVAEAYQRIHNLFPS